MAAKQTQLLARTLAIDQAAGIAIRSAIRVEPPAMMMELSA